MCFSTTASFAAGGVLSAVGVVTLAKAGTAREVPFASIPLLFGIQQFSEGVVWATIGPDAGALHTAMTYVYSFFSHVLWPVLVPIAVGLLETVAWRRRIITGTQAIGLAVGGFLLYSILGYPVTARVLDNSIDYDTTHFYLAVVLAGYFVATLASPLLSSHRTVNAFGALALVGALAAYGIRAATFVSVWCFFAALVSASVYLHFHRVARPRDVVGPGNSR